MDFSCRWKTITISLTCHSQWKTQQKQISLHGLQKFSFKGKISPYPAVCTRSWTAPEQSVWHIRSKGQLCCTLLIKRKETLSSSLARALLSLSHECAHGGCIHSPDLASQSLLGLQCCSIFRIALLILWFKSTMLLIYPSLQTHYCSTSIQLHFFNNCSKYQYLRYKSHGSICKTDRKFSKKLWKADFGTTLCHVRSLWTCMEQHCPVRSICVQECLSLWVTPRCPASSECPPTPQLSA